MNAEQALADLATITPYITSKIRRFGVWNLDMEPPEGQAMGRLRMAA
ncbi:hypothetical protein [Streptomyces sp. NBC_01006]|nr:hypothetical protein OG509_01450 [Streptomyces sp. NBC_01006]